MDIDPEKAMMFGCVSHLVGGGMALYCLTTIAKIFVAPRLYLLERLAELVGAK